MARQVAKPKGHKTRCLFLSHSGADTAAAAELKRRILATPAARKAGLTVWFDKDDLVAGQDWQQQLEDALTNKSTGFAVYVGSNGVINWVEREVRLALTRATGSDDFPFIPILAPDSKGVSALPPFATQYQGVFDPLGDDKALASLISASLGGSTVLPVLTDRPFIGLKAMTEDWSDRFFGRDNEVEELINRMRKHNLVAIVAESGAGKSSLAQAGLLPRFRGGALEELRGGGPDDRQRHVVIMRPGSAPADGLRNGIDTAARQLLLDDDQRHRLRGRVDFADTYETAHAIRCDLPHDNTQTLLIVDQFEELLTQTPEGRRQGFVDLLMALGGQGIQILLTARSDYFNLTSAYPELWTALDKEDQESVFRLRRISDDGIADAVSRPLAMAGLDDEDETRTLVSLFQRDMMDRPGDLALAQMALETAWRRRVEAGGLVNAYSRIGGIAGALAHEADRVREEKLTPEERELLVPLFVRLIGLGETGGVTRRTARFSELGEARSELAKKLTTQECARLLVSVGDDSVEISHEALVTQWPWLQNQIGNPEAANSIRRMSNLTEAAEAWQAASQDDKRNSLANPADHAQYTRLRQKHTDWLTDSETLFVNASAKAIEWVEFQRKALLYGSMVLTAVFAVLAVISVVSYFRMIDAIEVAEKKQIEAEFNQTAALAAISRATLSERPSDAMKLALAAWPRNVEDSLPRLQVSLEAVEKALATPYNRRILSGHEGALSHIAWSPDGKYLATASRDITGRVWHAQTGKQVAILKGHEGLLLHITWSPDGKQLATASEDNTGRVWEAETGKQVAIFKGHEGQVLHIDWSPDGKHLATASLDSTGRLWDPKTGRQVATLMGHDGSVFHITWSPNGKHLASASYDNTGRVWDADTGKQVAVLRGHERLVHHIAWSPDGKYLATASEDNTGRVWDADTGKQVAFLQDHEGQVLHITWSPDGKQLATASDDNTGRVWDAKTGKQAAILKGHEIGFFGIAVTDIAWSPDGKHLATTSFDNTGRVWDPETGKQIAILKGHESSLSHIAWSSDGKHLATASTDQSGRIWEAETGKQVAVLKGHEGQVLHITWSPDGKQLATASDDNTGRVWDAKTGKKAASLKGHEGPMIHITWSPDGKHLATASDDNTGRVWEAETGKQVVILKGHESSLSHIAWSPDGKYLATASHDNTGRVWEAETGKPVAILIGHETKPLRNGVMDIAWSPDGKHLATASHDNTGRVWEAKTGKQVAILKGHGSDPFGVGGVMDIAWSPDGKHLATASRDNTGRVWEAETGKQIAILKGHEIQLLGNGVMDIAWSPDGKYLATVSSDSTGRVWEAKTGKQVAILKGHEIQLHGDAVMEIAWSPNGKYLATLSADKTGRVWDAETGKQVTILKGHEGHLNHITWSPDGKYLATGSSDNTGHVWDVGPDVQGNLFEIACKSLPDTNLEDIAKDYSIIINRPICENPQAIPLPPWISDWKDETSKVADKVARE